MSAHIPFYPDQGCHLHHACLSCPLVTCWLDNPAGHPKPHAPGPPQRTALTISRVAAIARLPPHQRTPELVAQHLDVSIRVARFLIRILTKET